MVGVCDNSLSHSAQVSRARDLQVRRAVHFSTLPGGTSRVAEAILLTTEKTEAAEREQAALGQLHGGLDREVDELAVP